MSWARKLLLALWLAALPVAGARTLTLAPGDPLPPLQSGDTLELLAGVHLGPWWLAVDDFTLRALPGAILDGGGVGSALRISGTGVRVEGLTVRSVGSGGDLYEPDAAISAIGADGLQVDGLRADRVSAGVHVENAADVMLTNLTLSGTGSGPGITAYLTPNLTIEGGSLAGFLDGVYLERVERGRVVGLHIQASARYGLHAMFSSELVLLGNTVQGGAVGSAVMYGRDTRVVDNDFVGHHGPMAFGLLLQQERGSLLRDNRVTGNTVGMLMVAADGALLEGNTLQGNGVALLLDRLASGSGASATSLTLRGQTFLGNAADVAVADPDAAIVLAGNRFDRAPALDLDADGVIDLPYVATSAFATHAARSPDLLLLAFGPGISLWQRLEGSVPGLRGVAFADLSPRPVPPRVRPAGAGLPAAGLALLLALVGVLAGAPSWRA